jgi:hypothetical protein
MSDNTASSSSRTRIGALVAAAAALGAGALAVVGGARAKQGASAASGSTVSGDCPGPCHPQMPTD